MHREDYKYGRYKQTNSQTRWATDDEIQHATSRINLWDEEYPASGLPVLCDGNEAYVDNSDSHTLIFGATGSKKTRLFCMPMINMFARAGESFIVSDPKGELYATSAGLAKELGYDIIVLNFRDLSLGDRWNPLSIPYKLYHEGKKDEAMAMCADFVKTLAEPQIQNTKDAYWPEMAQCLLNGALELLMEAGEEDEVNVESLSRFACGAFIEDVKNISDRMHSATTAGVNLKSVYNAPPITRQSIIAVAYGMVRIFNTQKSLCHKLSESTFDISQIGRKKTAVYIIIPDEKSTYHFIVTMFVKQVYEILINEAQKERERALPIRVNFMLDEFCNIPRIPDMPMMISAARSRNMRFFLVVQSLYQLKSRYSDDANTIKGNCNNWVFLTTKEIELLKELSELCGDVGSPNGITSHPLISKSQLQRLNKNKGEALIMYGRQYPIISSLPDISAYKMYCNIDAPEFERLSPVTCQIFDIEKYAGDVRDCKRMVAFPSDESIVAHIRRKVLRMKYKKATDAEIFQMLEDNFTPEQIALYNNQHGSNGDFSNMNDDDDD